MIASRGAILIMSVTFSAAVGAQANPAAQGWGGVETILGRKGIPQPGNVMRFNFPRRDLRVTVEGTAIRPPFALGSWVAFKRIGRGQTMIMGDLVLLEGEINEVISALQAGGIEQTALHNHVLHETPRTMYLHVAAHGDEAKIAAAIRSALQHSATPLDTGGGPAPALDLDSAAIQRTLGYSGRANGGVLQFSIPRRETIREGGNDVPPSMGLGTIINFQSTGGGRAAVTGDFVMTGNEVNRVIRVLRENGIGITALHSHLIGETPRLYFMHYWANDDALKLARALRSALSQTNSQRADRPARS
jgi:uncharacterized protein DUF1259